VEGWPGFIKSKVSQDTAREIEHSSALGRAADVAHWTPVTF